MPEELKTYVLRFKKNSLYLHLKECEFRFNNRHNNLYLLLLKMVRNNPLK